MKAFINVLLFEHLLIQNQNDYVNVLKAILFVCLFWFFVSLPIQIYAELCKSKQLKKIDSEFQKKLFSIRMLSDRDNIVLIILSLPLSLSLPDNSCLCFCHPKDLLIPNGILFAYVFAFKQQVCAICRALKLNHRSHPPLPPFLCVFTNINFQKYFFIQY